MAVMSLGHTLVIANPTSHSGRGAGGARVVERVLATYAAATAGFELRLTQAQGDAQRWAADASSYDTVLVVGGDGVIHEVVGGLMALAEADRPRLGVIPLGSGNDFARTLGLTLNDPERSLAELLAGGEQPCDVIRVTSDLVPEPVYVAETLSFGLDAAIAIDTIARRADGSRQQGSALFVTSALKMFARERAGYPCTLHVDDEDPLDLTTLILAVQNGPTYGGGFFICPAAVPNDGLLSLCYNVRHPWVGHLLVLLGLARFGRHTRSRAVCLRTARALTVDFAQEPPCQVDGEPLRGRHFDVAVVPGALRVVAPRGWRW